MALVHSWLLPEMITGMVLTFCVSRKKFTKPLGLLFQAFWRARQTLSFFHDNRFHWNSKWFDFPKCTNNKQIFCLSQMPTSSWMDSRSPRKRCVDGPDWKLPGQTLGVSSVRLNDLLLCYSEVALSSHLWGSPTLQLGRKQHSLAVLLPTGRVIAIACLC